MNPDSFTQVHVSEVDPTEVGNGIVVHRLYRSGPERHARRVLLVTFPPASQWPGMDVHDPGPEEVYVIRGLFEGLTGQGSVHGPGTFLHFAAGTGHSPSTATGGELFVHYPEG